MYAEARASARREAEKETKMWQGAFAKAAEGGAGGEEADAAEARAVRFASPGGATGGGERAAMLSSLSAAEAEDGADSQSPADF